MSVERVVALRPWTRDEHVLVLRDGTRLTVSRACRERVEAGVAGR